MDTANPFASPSAQQFGNNQNPFAGFGDPTSLPPQQPQDPWASPVKQSDSAPQQPSMMAYSQNPYAAPPQPNMGMQTSSYPMQTSSYSEQNQFQQPAYQQPPPPQPNQAYQQPPQPPQPSFNSSNPFGAPAPAPMSQENAVVVSQFQSNPYANLLSDQQSQPTYNQNTNPYGSYSGSPQSPNNQMNQNNSSRVAAPAPAPYDPFAAFEAPPVAAPSTPQSFQQPSVEYNRAIAFSADSAPVLSQNQAPPTQHRASFDAGQTSPPSAPPPQQQQQQPPQQQRQEQQQQQQQQRQTSTDIIPHTPERVGVDAPREEEIPKTLAPPSYDFGSRPDVPPDRDPTGESRSPRNPYAMEIARRAPPGASPLPKADLVRKKGFVLSRISFRTIVMKKWKQSYWVQYGPHTMLWFRSQADFDDWLNNPYHSQAERNFLIKLAVNFVHDLYKPNVRGYQVTQCRTKGYGNKMVRQFKLERWMDYGPTIAAAFGSYNPKEVDDLREALVECMRNTPLNGGIRATGAVKQRPEEQQNREAQPPQQPPNRSSSPPQQDGEHQGGGYSRSSYNELPKDPNEPQPKEETESAAEEADLLDVDNWDDVPSSGQSAGYGQPPPAQPQPLSQPNNPSVQPAYGQQHPPGNYGQQQQFPSQQQQMYQQQQQQQQSPQGYSNALVATSQPQSYPGAPSMPQQQQPAWGQAPPAPQQQQQQWGSPPAGQQQQQQPWGQQSPPPGHHQPQQQQYGQSPQQPQQLWGQQQAPAPQQNPWGLNQQQQYAQPPY